MNMFHRRALSSIMALSLGSVSFAQHGAPLAQVYFTAGPNEETAGLFGYLTAAFNSISN